MRTYSHVRAIAMAMLGAVTVSTVATATDRGAVRDSVRPAAERATPVVRADRPVAPPEQVARTERTDRIEGTAPDGRDARGGRPERTPLRAIAEGAAPVPAPPMRPAHERVRPLPPAQQLMGPELPRRPLREGFDMAPSTEHSVARRWCDVLLDAIRNDFARPTVHARNLYHLSAAMWDAWAAYDPEADGVFFTEKHVADDVEAARREAISHAMNTLLRHRFASSPGVDSTTAACDALMLDLGFDPTYEGTDGDDPASLGNRIGQAIVDFGLSDGSNEQNDYANLVYEPINPPLFPDLPGNPSIVDADRWQPLALDFFIDQSGNPIPLGYPDFLSPEWGELVPFALDESEKTVHERDGHAWTVWHDPGPPPYIGGDEDFYYKWGFAMVSVWSAHLDPTLGVMVDISPNNFGNAPYADPAQWEEYYNFFEGGDWGTGYWINPATGEPYEPQIVPLGDYSRILAEFWADGPDSETPPGHWFTILNYVSDHPLFEKRLTGQGPILDDLEWDVKAYLAMGGTMHDVAMAAWSVKGYYDSTRPISALRYMADMGQSTDPDGPSYHPDGVPLLPGYIEVVTEQTIQPGERHEHLAGPQNENLGKIALYTWRGPEYIQDPATDVAGVGWILAENWWPYQRPSFVTPPFAGYVSGHSTYSRAAARVMEFLTGSEFFPGGLGEFVAPQNEFLVFEDGPSVDVVLQWARYMDASDQCSLSRIWGGIHPPADDLPGRMMGEEIAPVSFMHARRHFAGIVTCPGDLDASGTTDFDDLVAMLAAWGGCDAECRADLDFDGTVGPEDLTILLGDFGSDCG